MPTATADPAPFPLEITAPAGNVLRLERPARRIIALYGAYNELLLALGAGDRIVARTAADAALPELAALPAIGTHMRPNAELILAQKPDLVLQMSGRREAQVFTENLRALGLPVLVLPLESFADMFAATEILGRLTGLEGRAAELVRGWQARLAALRQGNAGRAPLRVFYEVRYPNLLGAGQKGITSEIIGYAGGENVLRQAQKLVRCNEEALIAADPDAYILQQGPMNPDPTPPAERPHFAGLRAVRAGHVLVVDEARYARPGPRAVDAAEELARRLRALPRP
ncbi:ABC transporter substrate-binding protein [Desulfovibrio legallii]|jgi:iron complex transport system substrate-binding protein|uniref:Iron complex transport system substrate-binding protein n=1 Tax=Desulfovibrio legallii TaxID=571438 RepID=A0A1G7PSM5_9BACT|nr:ABC transporter substrate-binding protein [Desulfovibrio legallii]SDF89234.1 iron complex transport system substrate-binding protein [Desulfovibrio legallii]